MTRWTILLVMAFVLARVFATAPGARREPPPTAAPSVPAGDLVPPVDPDWVRSVRTAPPERGADDAGRALHIACARATPVRAVFAGRVLSRSHLSSAGISLVLSESDGQRLAVYGHLLRLAPTATDGVQVPAGTVIGWVGDTGQPGPGETTLHFALRRIPQKGAWWQGAVLDATKIYPDGG